MPVSLLAAHPYILSGPTAAVFCDHAVYYEASPSVNRFGLRLCCAGMDTSFPQSAMWRPVFLTTTHLQNRLASSSASGTRLPNTLAATGLPSFELVAVVTFQHEKVT